MITSKQRLYLEWLGFNEYEIEEVDTELKQGGKPFCFETNQYYAWSSGYDTGIKAKINTTTISDALLMKKEPMTNKQKSCIDWIEEMTGAVYEGGSVSDFISEHIEEARFQSELNADANNPNG